MNPFHTQSIEEILETAHERGLRCLKHIETIHGITPPHIIAGALLSIARVLGPMWMTDHTPMRAMLRTWFHGEANPLQRYAYGIVALFKQLVSIAQADPHHHECVQLLSQDWHERGLGSVFVGVDPTHDITPTLLELEHQGMPVTLAVSDACFEYAMQEGWSYYEALFVWLVLAVPDYLDPHVDRATQDWLDTLIAHGIEQGPALLCPLLYDVVIIFTILTHSHSPLIAPHHDHS